MSSDTTQEKQTSDSAEIGGRYAKYVLLVLVFVYIFNFIDRQILSILAEDIKADLGITDAEIGFLYGTAFAVFYAVFGIPLGRLADVWTRKNLIAIGLTFWSVMTALSGTARGFATLATFRIGVGVGEASATPAAFSMLSDYFPARLRTTVLAIYSSGVYIGAGIGIFLGGVILDGWNGMFPDPASAPLGLKGWHVAFFAVGLPGLLMAIWVWTLKEPQRGQSDGIITPPHPAPFKAAWSELTSIVPPFSLYQLATREGGGIRVIGLNLIFAAAIALLFFGIYTLTGTPVQWIALGTGVYCTVCWGQALQLRDPASFAMIFKCRTLIFLGIGVPSIAFVGYGLGFWSAPFFMRVHNVSAAEVGTVLGLSAAVGGLIGVTLGGVIADRLRRRTMRGKLYVALISTIVSIPFGIGLLVSEDLIVAYIFNFLFALTSPMWIGPAASTVNDLVLPRMRAVASAVYILIITFVGLALGPFTMGQISDHVAATGVASGDALRQGMLWGMAMYVIAIGGIAMALFSIEQDENSRLERARAAGEEL